jgi:uncharacterized protein (DUF488 family)
VTGLADVRRFPRSRRHPQFNTEALTDALGDGYRHFEELGGRRRPGAASVNDGWEVAAFRGYADWMATPPFGRGIAALEEMARAQPTAMMCAEAPWWRCHRRLVSDALVVRGWTVCHILPGGGLAEHALPPFACVDGGRLTYPAPQLRLDG